VKVELPLTEPQEDFVFSESKYPAIVGGLGSGKSKGGTMRLVIKMLSDPGSNGAYYMPTYDLIKLRAMPGIEQDLEQLGIGYSLNKSDYSIQMHGYGNIILRSYDRPERIIAYETAHSIVDEIDTLAKDKAALVWRKVTERNRQKRSTVNTIGAVTTPDQGFNGFVYSKWGKNLQPGYELIKAPTASNPYLPDDYIEQIRSNYDPILAELYINGEFVSLNKNKVYHFFNRSQHHTNRVITDQDKFLHVGLDFNIGGTCATIWVIEENKPIAVDEFSSHDTYDFINNLNKYQGKTIIVYPDASGRSGSTNATLSDIGLIEQAGYQVDAPQANPAVRDRINAVNALLSHDRILINTDKCENLTHAMETQGYTVKGDPEKYDQHPAIDDWLDASGYFLNRKYPVSKPAINLDIRFQ
jgi:phage terminase large subunit